jgi:hypothetical protein
MGKRFQTKTVSYKDIYKMSISDRVSLTRSREGSNILSALTPEQYASLFPKYYQRSLPDIGGFLKAMTPEGREKLKNVTPGSATTDGWRSETQRRRDTLDRALPLGRGGSGQRQSRETAVPSSIRRLEEASGIKISDPKAKAQLSDQQKEVFELLKKGQLPADDPRLDFINKLSEEDRKQAGIETVSGEDGKQSFRMLPTAAETVPREDVERDLRKSSEETFSPRERATLDFIARREGSKDPNVIFGDLGSIGGTGRYSKALGLDKRPLTDHSIAEVLALQPKLTRLTREWGVGVINGTARGTSAVGSGQMIRSTLLSNLKALGIPESEWGNIKFDKNLQERLTLMNFKTSGIGDPNADPSTWNLRKLGDQYESLNPNRIGSKGNLRPGELDSIRNASSVKQHTGPIDSATIDAEIERRKNQEYEERQSRLAERSIPQLPPNIDPGFRETYDKMSPGQKQRVHQTIAKLGEGDEGVTKFNEIFKTSPGTVTQEAPAVRNPNFDINEFYQQTFNDARGYVAQSRGTSKAAQVRYGENTFSGLCGMATTGIAGALFRDKKFGERLGGNADSLSGSNNFLQKTGYYKDKKEVSFDQLKDKDYLDTLPIGSIITTAGGRKGAGHAQIKVGPGKWVSDGIQGNRILTQSGGVAYHTPRVHLPSAAALKKLNPDLVARDVSTQRYMVQEGVPFEQPSSDEMSKGIPQAPPLSIEQKEEQKRAAANVNPETVDSKIKSVEQSQLPTAAPTVEPTVQSTVEPTGLAAARLNRGPTISQEEFEKEANTTPQTANTIPVYADGGTIKSEDNKITAYPISDLKGDNSVVVDSNKKPLFTMNTQKESANFDPNTGNVTVNPESVTRNNPDSLNPPVKNDTQQEEPQQPGVTQMSRDRQPVSQNQSVGNDDMRENIIRSTMNPFTCPSFTRAISESNFKRTSSDGVGVGHFDHNNYSLK